MSGVSGKVGSFEGLLEAGKKSMEVSAYLELGFKQANLSGAALETQLKRTSKFAGNLADQFAVSAGTVREYAQQAAFLGGATGKANEDITTLAVVIDKASKGMVNGQAVVRTFSRGLGEPGAGKTSLVNTTESPLTLDFDKGVHRSDFRKDVLVIESWKQINDNMAELIKTFGNYNTVILDTIDTLLDYMGAWIIDQEPKLARNKLQFNSKLKDEFSLFVGKLKTLGKDVVMIAHIREKEEGDLRIKRPAITGGSYDRVLQTADFELSFFHFDF